MGARLKKTCKLLALFLMSLTVALVMALAVGCGDEGANGDNDPFGGTDIVQKDYDYKVEIIGTKTQTVKLKSGQTLKDYEPLTPPKKSGERFVGWYADGENTPYDWSRVVTKDLTIRARFEKVEGLNVINGIAFPQTDGGINTGAKDTLAFVNGEFTQGSITGTITPTSAENDCGIVFGADIPAEGADWENFDYYIVIINRDGYVILARIDGDQSVEKRWNEITNAELTGFSPSTAYKMTIKFNATDKLCGVYIDDKLVLSAEIDALFGTSYGVRAQIGGTVFGPLTVNPDDIITAADISSREEVGNVYVLKGKAEQIVDRNSYYAADSGNNLFISKTTFEEGTLTATVTPGKAGNDCGIIFGADVTPTASWENFKYYTVLINKDGVLLFSRIPWVEIGSFNIYDNFGGFVPSREYTITVKYSNVGYVEIYLSDKSHTEPVLAVSKMIGELYGTGIGYRSQTDGTVFGEFDIDNTDIPAAPEVNVGGYTVRNGALRTDGDSVITGAANTLAIVKDKVQPAAISYTMSRSLWGDDGLVFGLTDSDTVDYWEGNGTSYYFLFVDNSNSLRFAKIVNGWSEVDALKTQLGSINSPYTIDVVYVGDRIDCFVNGTRYISYTDPQKLTGTAYGIRAKNADVCFTENDLTGKHAVIIEGAAATITYVADGGTVNKPETDPVRTGYIFDGWYAAGSETAYDWAAPVTADIVISAKFVVDDGVDYTVTNGAAETSDFGYKATAEQTVIILRGKTFTQGALTASVKPVTAHDCGIIFGANVDQSSKWENFDYFTVIINNRGTVLFARVNQWGTMASSAVLEGNFDPANEYTLKVVYKDGYAKVYANDLLAMTVYIGALKGRAVGYRANVANSEFSNNVTIDETATPGIGEPVTEITLVKRAGAQDMTESDGAYTSTTGGTVYTSSNVILNRGGKYSAKINVSNAAAKGECNGIIFGVPSSSTSGDLWENYDYYFFFISGDGVVRFARVNPTAGNKWNEIKGDNTIGDGRVNNEKISTASDHVLTVSWDGNGVVCFVDDVMYFASDSIKFNGGVFGLRVQTAGVVYSEFTVVSYAEVDTASASHEE